MLKQLEKKVKEFLAKKALEKRQKRYMELLKAGGLFLQFVEKDLADSEKHGRPERRRFEKELHEKGKFCPEMLNYYFTKLEQIEIYIKNYQMMKQQQIKRPEVKKPNTQIISGYQPKSSTESGKIIPPQGGTGETKNQHDTACTNCKECNHNSHCSDKKG